MSKFTLKRSLSAVAVALSLGTSIPVLADASSGSIYGQAEMGKTVTIKNLATGFVRDVTVTDSGRFNFRQLPVGKYEVSDGSKVFTVTVSIGTGSSVQFLTDSAERIEVRGQRISAIDISSVESTTVFTQDQIQMLPVGRDITNVALLAPGTTLGDDGFGNLASFGGASVAENGYYINGFDVTNIRTFLSFADLPFDAIAQQQVKSGGYSAEYGRALGGVVNLVTKSGGNEWEFGGAVYWSPSELRGNYNDAVTRDPNDDIANRFHRYNSANQRDELSYNVWAGGPIVEDKLFVFAMVEGRKDTFDDFNRDVSDSQEESDPQALIKLDWNITDDHLLEFTGIFNESDEKNIAYENEDGVYYANYHGIEVSDFKQVNGGEIYIAKYTGHITDNLALSALVGKSTNKLDVQLPPVIDEEAALCPRAFDSRANASQVIQIGCWNSAQTFIPDLNHPGDQDTRTSIRLGAEYTIGNHSLRIGYDHETYESEFQGSTYTGGIYYRYFVTPDSRRIGGSTDHNLQPGDEYVRTWNRDTLSGSFEVENTAWYVEDNWQVTGNVLVYLGLRNETFTNFNGGGEVFAEADDQLAPRFGVAWDIDGDSSKKLFANVGRYFIPIASNTNIRAANAEPFIIRYWEFSGGIDPVTAIPGQLGNMIAQAVVGPDTAPNPATITDQNLKPMHQG